MAGKETEEPRADGGRTDGPIEANRPTSGGYFRLKVVRPDTKVHYSMIVRQPDPNIDFRTIVVDPGELADRDIKRRSDETGPPSPGRPRST